MKLNLGCGRDVREGYVNADLIQLVPGIVEMDINLRWPWEDSTFDSIFAYHVLEHGLDKIHIMRELWRVGAHGCVIHAIVPHPENPFFWADPTHRLCWHLQNFGHFTETNANWNFYEKMRFEIIKQEITCFEDGKPQNIIWRVKVAK